MKLKMLKKMRTVSLFCKSVVILMVAGLSMNVVTAKTVKKEIVTKVYGINSSGSLQIIATLSSNIEILTWDRNEVKVISKLTYDGNENKDDIDKLLNAFKSMKAQSSKDVLNLNFDLIVSAISHNKNPSRTIETTTELCNGDKISINASNIQTDYTIWIPATLSVKAESKFGKLKMASIKGDVNLNLSNSSLEMGDFGESGIFELRFCSNVSIGSGGKTKFSVYNSTVNTAKLKNLNIESRFSKFNIEKTNDVSLESYNSTLIFKMLNDIDASAKFSTIEINNITGKSKFDFHNSNLFGKNFQSMEISSANFSEFSIADIGEIKINLSNNSKYNFSTANTFSCKQSRFDLFKFDEIVVGALFPDASHTTININGTSASFSNFSGNFKFGSVNLKLNPNVKYNLNYDGTFGQFDIPRGISLQNYKSERNGAKTTFQILNVGATCNIELVTNNTTFKIE